LEDEAKRWDEASVLLFPSRYEGNSYTVLEAMACGCIPVAYWTGLVPNIGSVWGEFTDDFHEAAFRRGLDIALDRTDYPKFPEAFTLDMFGNDWKELLERE
jgi:glycosyltransferase involved in cell wall biosynthesis